MPTKPWFPTYIYDAPLLGKGKEDLQRTLLESCRQVREEDSEGRLWCQANYPAGYTSYGTRRNLHRTVPPFVLLEQKVWPHVQRFAHQLDMDLSEVNLAMTDCWVNIMTQAAVHPWHVHPGAVFSGTFYVSTPSGCSGLRFEDPRMEQFGARPPQLAACHPSRRKRICYDAQAGKVILFESWLRHEVAANPTPEERISVSFNYTWV